MTSLSEASSLTLLESMACECPLWLRIVGGNGEHFDDGVHGFLIPRGDSEKLAERLIALVRDPVKTRDMGQLARQVVLDNFDLQRALDEYDNFIRLWLLLRKVDLARPYTSKSLA